MKENILVVTVKSWNIKNFEQIKKNHDNYNWNIITNKDKLNLDVLNKLKPKYVFFPHWSWIIPKEIYQNYNCVVFHMTDLPFGRGGSPLQNLISRGIYNTKISALKVAEGLDAGDIYYKESLDLREGSAETIFKKASKIVFTKMIPFIVENNPEPIPQEGKIIEFKRRTPDQSNISKLNNLDKIYDFIRMLDAEDYPKSFIEINNIKIEFDNALKESDKIKANCIIKLRSKK